MKTIYDESYIKLIDHLQRAREKAGLTQAEAAARVGMSRAWVGKIERHELRLDVLHFVVLCRAYGLRPDRLVRRFELDLSADLSRITHQTRATESTANKCTAALIIGLLCCTSVFGKYDLPKPVRLPELRLLTEPVPWVFRANTPAVSNLAVRLTGEKPAVPNGKPLLDTLAALSPDIIELIEGLFGNEHAFLSALETEITQARQEGRQFGFSGTRAPMFGIRFFNSCIMPDGERLCLAAIVTASDNTSVKVGDEIVSCDGQTFRPGLDLSVIMSKFNSPRTFTLGLFRNGAYVEVKAGAKIVTFTPAQMQCRRIRDAIETVILRKIIEALNLTCGFAPRNMWRSANLRKRSFPQVAWRQVLLGPTIL